MMALKKYQGIGVSQGFRSGLIRMVTTVIIGIIVINILAYLRQPAMIYYPTKAIESTPQAWGLDYENVFIPTEDGQKLHGWFIPNTRSSKVLLFFHGNAGNISHRRESIEIFYRLGLSVFIFDYRGYGKSSGKPSEAGTYADARAAWRYLTETRKIAPANIIVFGRSLGGAVATKLASEVRPAGLIVESVFSSARDMANRLLPVIAYVIWLRFDYNTVANIRQVKSPVLVIHSPDDDIIPYQLGINVFEAANEPKKFLRLRGDHNSGFYVSGQQYIKGLSEFLASL